MAGRLVTGVLGGLLWGFSVYGCLQTDPLAKPFGYASFVIAKSHGMVGFLRSQSPNPKCSESVRFMKLMDCVQLTLINSELYEQSQGGTGMAAMYALCMAPLIYNLAVDPNQKLWKCLLTIYNCCSLTFRAQDEANLMWLAMALLHLINVSGIDYMSKRLRRKTGTQISFMARIIITYFAVLAFRKSS
ncbi:hypothetical protein KR018_008895 [Drosophila ironensis]|nr:hypothetical protein KR018_008895 [Drosophila ironensis]